ncbi:hypothetical protein [Priestia endophytica]|uniref:hypothetical protein n=1 Tax=Priestia endophytica TaxID=135735 RepID=UPI00227E9E77|nr:hypothetical protein [Priestia endophytica]MCY8234158.1 hypothetical protein [Priestia endophytica]
MDLLSLSPDGLENAARKLEKEASSLQNLQQDLSTLFNQDHSWKTSSKKEFNKTAQVLLENIKNTLNEIRDKSTYLKNLSEQARLAHIKEKLKEKHS